MPKPPSGDPANKQQKEQQPRNIPRALQYGALTGLIAVWGTTETYNGLATGEFPCDAFVALALGYITTKKAIQNWTGNPKHAPWKVTYRRTTSTSTSAGYGDCRINLQDIPGIVPPGPQPFFESTADDIYPKPDVIVANEHDARGPVPPIITSAQPPRDQ